MAEESKLSFMDNLRCYWQALMRDFHNFPKILKNDKVLAEYSKKDLLVSDAFREMAARYPDKACIIYNDAVWTYKDLENYSNQVGNLFMHKYNLMKGDCVSMFIENCPEFIGIWLGLAKIGVISAFINTNLKNQQLIHTITAANSKAVIYSDELEASINEIKGQLDPNLKYLILGPNESQIEQSASFDMLVKGSSTTPCKPSEPVHHHDILFYIYTSGTTGLPKPAIIKHSRYFLASTSFHNLSDMTSSDIVYVSLPLYHANASLIGTGMTILYGATIVLRKKFSASNFWKDCIRHKCTIFIYIGEVCRFLLNQPPSELDMAHSIRFAVGNGLRKNVWEEFDRRFKVQFMEFYASSEGNCNMVNIERRKGTCGFIPLINRFVKVLPIAIIRIDENMEPIRNSKGLCIECKPGEKGLLVGIIKNTTKSQFNGYANNKEASNKKIIENVFKRGDRAFNSGDSMVMDKYGYVFFCDRLGDTYRWRGENISTVEIENVLCDVFGTKEIVVYGVEVPGEEGRAGMAAISATASNVFNDMSMLMNKLKTALPPYSRPLFLRMVEKIEYTGTFKVKKTNLVQEGYDLNKMTDRVYYLDSKESAYKQLTPDMYNDIMNRNFRF